jgi:membrane-bound lytic murein transglycosylase A
LDQDTGGAIRAPGRCDVYVGVGDEAGKMAGQVYEEGKLYYIFLKPQFMNSQPVPTAVEPGLPQEQSVPQNPTP